MPLVIRIIQEYLNEHFPGYYIEESKIVHNSYWVCRPAESGCSYALVAVDLNGRRVHNYATYSYEAHITHIGMIQQIQKILRAESCH